MQANLGLFALNLDVSALKVDKSNLKNIPIKALPIRGRVQSIKYKQFAAAALDPAKN